jgi:putative oxidoreductase
VAVGVAVTGAGTLSLDDAIGLHALGSGWPGLLVAVGAGLGGGIGQLAMFFRPPAPVPAPPEERTPPGQHQRAASRRSPRTHV